MHSESDHSFYNIATPKDMIIIFRSFLCVLGVFLNELGLSPAELVKCKLSEKCTFYPWMHWETSEGACGKQSQLRLRKFCCPDEVITKTASTCLQACNKDITTKMSESRPCIARDHAKGDYLLLIHLAYAILLLKGCAVKVTFLLYFSFYHFQY